MAKNFEKSSNIKTIINDVKQANFEKAKVITIKMIKDDDLFDYPLNGEDINDTIDLENSMKELGFTDPIEVTGYNMHEGTYMIISGHRRRKAGVNIGITTFPCIIKNFINDKDLRNYVLLANSQRDSSKDPLLYCKRYKMHEEYLINCNFEGNKREEIAKRLGISIAQSDRYKQFNKIILPIWDMVRNDKIGMSNVLAMASHKVEEQEEILSIFLQYLEKRNNNNITREDCNIIIKEYRNGKRKYDEIYKQDNGSPAMDENETTGVDINTNGSSAMDEDVAAGVDINAKGSLAMDEHVDASVKQDLANKSCSLTDEQLDFFEKKELNLIVLLSLYNNLKKISDIEQKSINEIVNQNLEKYVNENIIRLENKKG